MYCNDCEKYFSQDNIRYKRRYQSSSYLPDCGIYEEWMECPFCEGMSIEDIDDIEKEEVEE
jgi:hypothetical protein